MPALFAAIYGAIASLIGAVVDKFLKFVTTRAPVLFVAIMLIVAVSAAYLSSMKQLTTSLGQTIPQVVLDVWGWFMPGNAIPCLMAVLTARIVRWSYQKYEKLVVFKAKSMVQG